MSFNSIENFNNTQLSLIQSEQVDVTFDQTLGDYIRLTIFTENNTFAGYQFSSKNDEIEIYNVNGNTTVKPNEILEENYVPEGNYKLQFDFLRNVYSYFNDGGSPPNFQYAGGKFIVSEISPSRKEVRLKARNYDTIVIPVDNVFQSTFQTALGSVNNPETFGDYTYDWVLTLSTGENIPITNYTFDEVSDSSNITLILRLNEPVPISLTKLSSVGVEKEIITTQTQDIMYVSNIKTTSIGGALEPDLSVWSQQTSPTGDTEQNYESLIETASFSELDFDTISDGGTTDDINLNIDFSNFENHVIFGSAVSKLENFKTKVSDIETHLSSISASLVITQSTYVDSKRKDLFDKIQTIKNTFTPYERFLYGDNQKISRYSAPGIGRNLAHTIPVTQQSAEPNTKTLLNYDGFRNVYKHSNEDCDADSSRYVDLFTDKYKVEDAPFNSISSSVYLSFLMRANDEISLTWQNRNENANIPTPASAFYSNRMLDPSPKSGSYQRYIYQTSQSYWRPAGAATGSTPAGEPDIAYVQNIIDADAWGASDSNYWQILSSSDDIANASVSSSSDNFMIQLTDGYNTLGSFLTGSDIPFSGSVMPSGELFRIFYTSGSGDNGTPSAISSSYITDVKITLKDPTNTIPFSHLYVTSSNEWDDWYTEMHASASSYDDDNIHSLVNNIPTTLKDETTSGDLQTFINMWGEHFDGIRNSIDTYATFYKRRYDDNYSVPSNLLPILGDNLGWEMINPFSSSLSNYFSAITGSGGVNAKTIKENTWRKVLNNLVYIYKSKGTHNSIRALLNAYGYPPDLISINEYGGSTEPMNPHFLTDDVTTFDGLSRMAGNISFVKEPKIHYMLNFQNDKSLKLDWHMNDANANGVEFNMIPHKTTTSMSLLESSGSGDETAWILEYVPSASVSNKGSMRLRINGNGNITGSILTGNSISMSSDYFTTDGNRLFNVYVTAKNSSVEESVVNRYTLSVASHDGDKIKFFSTSSQTVNIGAKADDADIVNNWRTTGSRHPLSASNLYVGENFKGYLSDIKLWKTQLSASKIKQHTLNPESAVGNVENSYDSDIVYRFRLNENYSSGSISGSKTIVDANPNNIKDYSRTVDFNANQSTYIRKFIDIVKLVPRSDFEHKNSNMITTDRSHRMDIDLNPTKTSFVPDYNIDSGKRQSSVDVDFTKSPSDKLDEYATNILADKDITQHYSKWDDLYEPFYKDLDDLRNKIFKDITIDINEYIEAQANLFNPSLIEAIQALLPARSKFTHGVVIKPNILERTKYEHKKAGISQVSFYIGDLLLPANFEDTVYVTPYENTPIIFNDYYNMNSNYNSIYENTSLIYQSDVVDLTSTYDVGYKGDVNFINYMDIASTSEYVNMYNSNEINLDNQFVYTMLYTSVHDSNVIDMIGIRNYSMTYVSTYDSNNVDMDAILTSMDYVNFYSDDIDFLNEYMSYTMIYNSVYDSNLIDMINESVEYTMTYGPTYDSNNLDIVEITNLSMVFNSTYDSNNVDMDAILTSAEYNGEYDTNKLNISTDYIKYTSTYNGEYESNILDIISSLNLDSTYVDFYLGTIDETGSWPYKTFTGTYVDIITNNIDEINDIALRKFSTPLDSWGTDINSTWIMNMDKLGGNEDYNTGYYNDKFLYYAVGDMEVVSASRYPVSCSHDWDDNTGIDCITDEHCEAHDYTCHYNRLVVDEGKGYTYNSYFGSASIDAISGAPIDGRPMGRTRFFITGSDGSITYPSNHWKNFTTLKDQMRYLFYERKPKYVDLIDRRTGEIITNARYNKGEFPHHQDLFPDKQFYSIEVKGSDSDTVLKVERADNRPSRG